MKYIFVKQKDLKDCGCCCLLMLTRYFGGSVSIEYLRDITNTNRSGVSAFDLVEGSKKIGFSAYGVNGDVSSLNAKNTPCIAHVIINKRYEHFIVIYKIDHKKRKLIIADPGKNRITKMSFEEFNKISTGNFIFLKPNKKITFVDKNKKFDTFVHKLSMNNFNILLHIFFLSLLISLSQIFLSFKFKIYLEYVIEYATKYNLLILSLIFISIIFLKEASDFKRNSLINKLNHTINKDLLNEIYNHILSLPYLYYKNRTTGEIVSRINDVENIRNVLSKFLVSILFDLVLLIGSIFVLFTISYKLTLLIIVTLIILTLLILLFNRSLEDRVLSAKRSGSELNSFLVESIDGIETIRNQNIVDYIKNKFMIKNSFFNKNSFLYGHSFIILTFLKKIIISVSDLIIIIVGSTLILDNNLTLAGLITFITLMGYVFSPIFNITDLILSLKEAKISYERIRELYEIDEEKHTTKFRCNDKLDGNILIKNLSYSYNNFDAIINNVNMEIKNGSKVLIYGDSGSGKSTIAKVISGMLNIKNNCVLLDDMDINKYSSSYLRDKICYVSANDKLFNDSIYKNIVFDRSDISELNELLSMCKVDDFVSKLPMAYDMMIEENGFNLSGGQKQRILLARSLLKNSDIYILDEALNQVDIDSEREILKKVFNKYKDKTFIYISHRFNNEDLFDKKYFIKDGVCV